MSPTRICAGSSRLDVYKRQNLNIATMRVFRRSVGGDAMVALELDGSADTELIARLSALQGVYHVAYLAAKEE